MSSTSPDLRKCIESVIENIEFLKEQLGVPGSDPATGLAAPKAPVSEVQRLKYSVDQLRLFLWAYLDSWSQGGITPELRLQRIRMEAATDMLRLLHKEFSSGGAPDSPETARLREQLRLMDLLLAGRRGEFRA